jgi:RNA polymerase sigma factor (sigma-70 family)
VDELYREHRVRLFRVAYLLTGSRDVADDLAHEAFARLWPRIDGVRDPGAYLHATVVNLSRGHLRRAATAQRHPPAPPGPELPPEIDEIWGLLWTLPERQRAALVLRYYADLDVAGVAAALGCRSGTAKSLIHRGIARLREVVEP